LLCCSGTGPYRIVSSWPSNYHYLFLQLEVQRTDVATRVIGANEPDPPPTQPTTHLITHFTFNQSISTLCPTTHQHILIISLLALTMNVPCHRDNRHVTESHFHTSAYIITWCPQSRSWRALNVLVRHRDSCWCWWWFSNFFIILFHFSFSFSLFQAIKPPVVLLLGCGVLVRLTSHCDSFISVCRDILSCVLRGEGGYLNVNNVNNNKQTWYYTPIS
jgi:hypothetical protein